MTLNAVETCRRALVALFAAVGSLHFIPPSAAQMDAIVPDQLPGPARAYTVASGIAELTLAGLLSRKETAQLGGVAAAALLVAVFPANVKMALDWQREKRPAWQRAVAYGRLPLQAPMIYAAVRVARGR